MVAGWQKYSLYQRGSLLDERVETLVCTGIAGTCGLAGERDLRGERLHNSQASLTLGR